jgi:hypothetical protein
MRVPRGEAAARENLDALCGSMTTLAGRPNLIGSFRFDHRAFPVAHQAAPAYFKDLACHA